MDFLANLPIVSQQSTSVHLPEYVAKADSCQEQFMTPIPGIAVSKYVDLIYGSKLGNDQTIIGCNEPELAQLITTADGDLPIDYLAFMAAAGKCAGCCFIDAIYQHPQVLSLTKDFMHRIECPVRFFVFSVEPNEEQCMLFKAIDRTYNQEVWICDMDNGVISIAYPSFDALLANEILTMSRALSSRIGEPETKYVMASVMNRAERALLSRASALCDS